LQTVQTSPTQKIGLNSKNSVFTACFRLFTSGFQVAACCAQLLLPLLSCSSLTYIWSYFCVCCSLNDPSHLTSCCFAISCTAWVAPSNGIILICFFFNWLLKSIIVPFIRAVTCLIISLIVALKISYCSLPAAELYFRIYPTSMIFGPPSRTTLFFCLKKDTC